MKTKWALILLAVMGLFALAIQTAKADDTDPIMGDQRGGGGSPTLPATMTITVGGGQEVTIVEAVPVGEAQIGESISLPMSDGPVTCQASNAFLDGGAFNASIGGFAPTISGDDYVCSWSVFTGEGAAVDDGTALTEFILEQDCQAYNDSNGETGLAQDCIGIEGGTPQDDSDFFVYNEGSGTITVTANSTLVPEPGSLPMLAVGLAGLGFLGYRRRQQLV